MIVFECYCCFHSSLNLPIVYSNNQVTRRDGKVLEIIRDVNDCDEEETGCDEDYDSDGYTVGGFDDSEDDDQEFDEEEEEEEEDGDDEDEY